MKHQPTTIQERIGQLTQEISKGIYGKDRECRLAMLAALAGESIILLGPPGVAKSMIARRMKRAFVGAQSFEYLMNRFSTPDEIFGPVSISRLKSEDVYERTVEGFLPTADVVFLDEIWKAGPAIQNTLLTVINERIFRNGRHELRLPLKLLVAASNELPAEGEGLEALWDRFLIRAVCSPIDDNEQFYTMLQRPLHDEDDDLTAAPGAITPEEYAAWNQEIERIALPRPVFDAICHIRKNLGSIEVEGSSVRRDVYVSDRRWRHIVRLLQTSAFVHGRGEVSLADLILMSHCLWNTPEEFENVRMQVIAGIFCGMHERTKQLLHTAKIDLRHANAQSALKRTFQMLDRDKQPHNEIARKLVLVDKFYFEVENHGIGHTYIFASDFLNMKPTDIRANAAQDGIMYKDPANSKRTIIATFAGGTFDSSMGITPQPIKIFRDDEHLYIDGVRYELRRRANDEEASIESGLAAADKVSGMLSNDNTVACTNNLSNEKAALIKEMRSNVFCNADDIKAVEKYANEVGHNIAEVRGILAEIDKLQL